MVAAAGKIRRKPVMKIRKIAQMTFAVIAIFLGGFWFLQGVGMLNVCPILCFADCACIEGGSRSWSIVGAIFLITGIFTMIITTKRK
jgi:hypothetical protein